MRGRESGVGLRRGFWGAAAPSVFSYDILFIIISLSGNVKSIRDSLVAQAREMRLHSLFPSPLPYLPPPPALLSTCFSIRNLFRFWPVLLLIVAEGVGGMGGGGMGRRGESCLGP